MGTTWVAFVSVATALVPTYWCKKQREKQPLEWSPAVFTDIKPHGNIWPQENENTKEKPDKRNKPSESSTIKTPTQTKYSKSGNVSQSSKIVLENLWGLV